MYNCRLWYGVVIKTVVLTDFKSLMSYLFSIARNCFFFIRFSFAVFLIGCTISAFLRASSLLCLFISFLFRAASSLCALASLSSCWKCLIFFNLARSFVFFVQDVFKGLSNTISECLLFLLDFHSLPDFGFPLGISSPVLICVGLLLFVSDCVSIMSW